MTITVNPGAQIESTSGLTVAVPYPTGVNAGDLLIIIGSTRASGGATTPSGWTSIANFAETSSSAVSLFAFYQNARAAGGESGTVTVSRAGTVSLLQMYAVGGVDTGTVLDVPISTVDNTTATSSSSVPSITTVTDQAMLVYASALNGTTHNATPPAGFTETADRATGSADAEIAYKLGQAVGATGAVSCTWSVAGKNIGLLFAIRPAAGGTNYTATISDSVGITDSAAATTAAVYTVTISDGVGITDTSAPQAIDRAATFTDAVGFTDTAADTVDVTQSVSDPLGLTDQAAGLVDGARVQSDALAISDSVTVTVAASPSVSDGVGITDVVTVNLATAGAQSIADPLGIVDSLAAAAALARPISDGVTLTDQVTATLSSSTGSPPPYWRVITVPADPRLVVVPADGRVIVVPADPRIVEA